ncbi:MAG: helix-turn-helix domain-containing protein [Halanaerobium sp.]
MRQLFTKKEVATKLNVSVRTIDRLILSGQIKAYKLGRSVRIDQEQLDEYLQESVFDPLKPGEVSVATGFGF